MKLIPLSIAYCAASLQPTMVMASFILRSCPRHTRRSFFDTVDKLSSSQSRPAAATGSRDVSSLQATSGSDSSTSQKSTKGRILVLGGNGFLGQAVVERAVREGYDVTSLSRRGAPDDLKTTDSSVTYRKGDARDKAVLSSILLPSDETEEEPFSAVVHCIGLLFDSESGLAQYNLFASGSKSMPDSTATYDDVTRRTAFNAIEVTEELSRSKAMKDPSAASVPFVFISAAEAGWPDVSLGPFVEDTLAPSWLRRYLEAKRSVEGKLKTEGEAGGLRPVIFRPSLIFSMDRPLSLPAVGAFFVGNAVGLPFVDRPVTVQSLAEAVVTSIGKSDVRGVQRYTEIDSLSS